MPREYPVNKPMRAANFAYLALFLLLVVSKNFVPAGYGGWSNPPIVDIVFLLGIGICFSIIGIGYLYYSWFLNATDFMDWYIDQLIFGKSWAWKWWGIFPEYTLWSMRVIGGPVLSIVGIALTGFMLFGMVAFIIRSSGF